MDSNVELPLESRLWLERVKRYIAGLKDLDALREMALQGIEYKKTNQYLNGLLTAEVLRKEME